MEQNNKVVAIVLTVLLGVFFQVLFVFADNQDTPNKAVVEFAKAYYKFDPSMSERLCSDVRTVEDVDVVSDYIYKAKQRAETLGYSLFYIKEKLYHVETYTVSKDHERAQIQLVCERKPPLKSFFTGEIYHVNKIYDVVKEEGKWKVCGNPFSM